MPDCWLEVSIRKVLLPATSTPVFSRFPCVYKQMLRWFPTFQVAATCFSCSPPDLNVLVTNFIFCIHVKEPLPLNDNPIAVNFYFCYFKNFCSSSLRQQKALAASSSHQCCYRTLDGLDEKKRGFGLVAS